MSSLINDSVALSQLLEAQAGSRLPLSSALYACSELARLVACEHELGRTVTGLDPEHIRCTRSGGIVLGGARVHHPDARADVFAVGGIFYRLLTGKTPAARDVVAPSHFNPGVDAELDAVILGALSPNSSQRPGSVRVLESALTAVFEELELTPAPEELAELVRKVPRRPAAVAPVVAARVVPKAAAPVAKPILVRRAPPPGWYAVETIDEELEDEGEELETSATEVPSWQTQERERRLMVGISAAMVVVALLWALWPSPKSSRAEWDGDSSVARVTARR